MGFMSHRRRDVEVQPEQKWDYIVRTTINVAEILSEY